MQFKSRTITLSETAIHLVICGRGRPIVLIHGLTNNWEGHIPLAKELGKKYTVYIPDMPGYGDSGTLPHYTVETMTETLFKLLIKISVHPVAVIGLSMGGFIAAHFAKQFVKDTDSAVIIGPVLKDKGKKAQLMNYFFKTTDKIPAGRRILKKIVGTKYHGYLCAKYLNMYRFNKQLIDRYGLNGRRKMTKDAYIEMGISVAEYDLDKTLKSLRIPTLLLYGGEDRISHFSYAQKFITPYNSYLSLQVISEAGHVVSLEKPKESAKAIIDFLTV